MTKKNLFLRCITYISFAPSASLYGRTYDVQQKRYFSGGEQSVNIFSSLSSSRPPASDSRCRCRQCPSANETLYPIHNTHLHSHPSSSWEMLFCICFVVLSRTDKEQQLGTRRRVPRIVFIAVLEFDLILLYVDMSAFVASFENRCLIDS